jgi:peptidoglycan hydrolase-like protein with peptidoglycan-binding domain
MTGDPTIYYGDLTKQAVLAYQKASGLAQTGILDQAALSVLYSDAAVKAPAQPVSSVAEKSLSSEAAVESKSGTIVFSNMIPAVNAAAADRSVQEASGSDGGMIFSVVLLSAFLSGVFMTVKRIRALRKKTAAVLIKK